VKVAFGLASAGHDAVHVRELGMQSASDEAIFSLAEVEGRILISADSDFGTLLALRGSSRPSVILFRRGVSKRPDAQTSLLLNNLDAIAEDLSAGSAIVFEHHRIRIRKLPIQGS
jgi:predicted nuclease of predicted toxin-antitoxin system